MHPESAHQLGINTRGPAQRLAPTRRFDDRGRGFFDHEPSPVGAGFHAFPRRELRVDVTVVGQAQRPAPTIGCFETAALPISNQPARTARLSQIMLQPSLHVSNSRKF